MQTEVAIIGAGLTGLTAAFQLLRKGIDCLLLERTNRVGGQIRTYLKNEFTYESGPNTGVISYPEIAELFAALSPDCTLQTAREEAKRRLIWKGNRFHALPSGPLQAVGTPLFSLGDKFNILLEPLRPKGTDPDESVADLARRRLGASFLDYAVDPFLSGVYAGNPHTLVTRYALPKLYNLEQTYGSFIRGAIAKSKLPQTERDRLATKQVFSAQGGLESLTQALAKQIGPDHILLDNTHIRIQPVHGKGWQISCTSKEGPFILYARHLVTTTGAYCLPELLPFVAPEAMQHIQSLEYAPVIQVSVGIRDTGQLRFNAFGGLVPSKEKKDVLGILFPAACFGNRAPEGGALFSFFIGGKMRPDLISLNDREIENLILRNLHDMLKFPPSVTPDLLHIFRHTHAIPQYEKSSGPRLETIRKLEKQYTGLTLAGNIRDGIGMADRIRQGCQIAGQIAAQLGK